jgi:hypothetical protein
MTKAFLLENWGSLASVIGAIFTVIFSMRASSAALAAKTASETTRSKLQEIDLLSELNRLNGGIDDLLRKLEIGSWGGVTERSNDLRVSIAAINRSHGQYFDKDICQQLIAAATQFKTISTSADRVNILGGDGPDIARYRKIVVDQKETVTLAIQDVKVKMGATQ